MEKKNVVKQLTELNFKVSIVLPGHLPCAFIKEFAANMENCLRTKAQEVAKSWEGGVEVMTQTERKHGRRFSINQEEATDAARNYIVDNDVLKNEGKVAMKPEERKLLREAIETREDVIARQKGWIEGLTYEDF